MPPPVVCVPRAQSNRDSGRDGASSSAAASQPEARSSRRTKARKDSDFDTMMVMEASEARGHGGLADSKSKPSFRRLRSAERAVLAAGRWPRALKPLSFRGSGGKLPGRLPTPTSAPGSALRFPIGCAGEVPIVVA